MSSEKPSVEQILTILTESPAHIASIVASLEPEQLQQRPFVDEWSAVELLAHLRACADVWGGCIMTLLNEDHPTIKAVSPRTWIKKTDYPELKFEDSFAAFTKQRDELLATLKSLSTEQWSRSATIKGIGAPREQDILYYAQRLTHHERIHHKQFEQIVTALSTK